MSNSAIQEIFRLGYDDNENYASDNQVKKIAYHIMDCHSPRLGAIKTTCGDCGADFYSYRGCGDRHCPQCQGLKQLSWVEAKSSEVIENVPYYHVVFTIPSELNQIFFQNKRKCYSILFKSVAETIATLGRDKNRYDCELGFICVLHTWGSNLSYHPHIHVIIMGCGLNDQRRIVRSNNDKFLFPVKVMSRLFRGKLLYMLKSDEDINSKNDIDYDVLYGKEWVVYCKETIKNAENVIKYLSRYTNRIAISDKRIISYDCDHVTFSYKDYKNNSEIKTMTLTIKEFLRRFLMHVLPKGFIKVRSYGLLCNKKKAKSIKVLRLLLRCRNRSNRFKGMSNHEILKTLYPDKYGFCKKCGSRNISVEFIIPEKLNTG